MGNYNPIYHTIWTSNKFNLLKRNSRYLFLYLLSNPKVTQTGIYNIMLKQMTCDTDLTTKEVESAIDELQANNLIKYWQDENVIFILDNFKFARNTIKNCAILNKVITSQKQLYQIPELWEMFENQHSVELERINGALMKQQSNKNNDGNKDIDLNITHNIQEEIK